MTEIKKKYQLLLNWLRGFAYASTAVSMIFLIVGALPLARSIGNAEMLMLAVFAPLVWLLYFAAKAWFSFLTRLKI